MATKRETRTGKRGKTVKSLSAKKMTGRQAGRVKGGFINNRFVGLKPVDPATLLDGKDQQLIAQDSLQNFKIK